jgi:hypothetical protein
LVVTEGRAPVLRIECQRGDAPPAPGLRYLKARFPRCEAWQASAGLARRPGVGQNGTGFF